MHCSRVVKAVERHRWLYIVEGCFSSSSQWIMPVIVAAFNFSHEPASFTPHPATPYSPSSYRCQCDRDREGKREVKTVIGGLSPVPGTGRGSRDEALAGVMMPVRWEGISLRAPPTPSLKSPPHPPLWQEDPCTANCQREDTRCTHRMAKPLLASGSVPIFRKVCPRPFILLRAVRVSSWE